jgi:tape measure domain-containing protein
MTSITALNVRLGMDASNFSAGADLARNEVNRVAAIMRQSVPPAEKFQKEIELLDRAFSDAGKQSKEYANALDMLAQKYRQGVHSQAAIEAQQLHTQKMREGEQVTKSLMSSQERYSQEAMRLYDLHRQGAISTDTYNRGLASAKANTDEARNAAERHSRTLAEAKQITISMLSPIERHQLAVKRLGELHKSGAIDAVTYRRAIAQADADLKKLTTTTNSAAKGHSQLTSQVKSFVAAYVGIQTVTKSIKLAVDAEQAAASFKVLTGSVNNANFMLSQMRAFSDVSPLSFGGVQDAAKTLLAFNVPMQDVMTSMQMLGDVSMGNEERFKSLTLAFAQVSAAGKLTGNDLLQFVNAGFNPLQEISKRTGESMSELRDRMSAGAITAAEVTQAFADATGEGGKFHGMTDELAETMGGKLAIAMADIEKAGIRFGEKFAPVIMMLTDGMEDSSSAIDGVLAVIEKMADGLGFIVALATDAVKVLSAIFRGETYETLTVPIDTTSKFLDSLEERDRKREQALNEAATAFDEAAAAEAVVSRSGVDDMTENFEKAIGKIKEKIAVLELGEEAARNMELQAAGYTEEQIKQITAQEKILDQLEEQKKIEEDLAKQRTKEAEKLAKQLEEVDKAFTSEVASTMAAVEAYYQQQRQANEKRRQDVSAGPGAGMDADSAASAKFMADQVNRSIGAAAVPDLPTPGEKEIADKTKELLLAQREANKKQDEQLRTAKELLQEFKENKFQRIRN